MKKLLFLMLGLAMVAMSCKEPEPGPESQSTPKWCSTEVTKKNVLIEEFTGQGCGYCPDGHRRAHLIAMANPGRAFVASINAGGYAREEMYCHDADTIHNGFDPTAYPIGMVNRYNGFINRGEWSPWCNRLMMEDACVNIAAKGTIDTSSRQLKVTVELYYTNDAPSDTNFLMVYVLQDNIMAAQSNGKLYNPDFYDDSTGLYRHMHTLRFAIPSPWGEPIKTTKKGNLVTREYTYQLPAKLSSFDVVLKDLNVLAFISQGEKYNILNVCGADITLK